MFDQDKRGKKPGGQPVNGGAGDIRPPALLQSEIQGEATGENTSGTAEDGTNELYLMQTLHHVLARAIFNGYQNEMALPITSAEVPRLA